ncbi:MAG: transcriptional repressor [Pirellulaceae bacterium]|nr:transcriptional repressor [Pirellulaceae bacterium]
MTAKIRNTRQRRVILEELRKTSSHPTAEGVHEIVRHRIPNISLGTVYRNLEVLVRLGEIKKLELGGRPARFDGNPADHFHVQCVRCGRVDDVHASQLDLSGSKTNYSSSYRIVGYTLQFFGICPECDNSSTNTIQEITKC